MVFCKQRLIFCSCRLWAFIYVCIRIGVTALRLYRSFCISRLVNSLNFIRFFFFLFFFTPRRFGKLGYFIFACFFCLLSRSVSNYDEVVFSLRSFSDAFFFLHFLLLVWLVCFCLMAAAAHSLTLALVYLLTRSFIRSFNTRLVFSHSLHRLTQNICFRFPFLLRAVFLFEFCVFFFLCLTLFVSVSVSVSSSLFFSLMRLLLTQF